ncbi:MAG: sugar nucleotide-binding protein [Bacteroidales bacterium]|nr:sugar nucleotide-binding protein [Bacteroidales bacterium]
MRVFVIGCNGLIGHVIALYFKERGHVVSGYDPELADFVPQYRGSYYSGSQIEAAIKEFKPDAIINCTAVVNQTAEDNKAEAAYINTYFPHLLEGLTAQTGIVVVHRSTDCIFSGAKGQYVLEDTPDATSFYARTKAVGELDNNKDITIRVSLIGPALKDDDGSLLNWYLKQQGSVNGYMNAIWTGLTTLEYAKTVENLLNQNAHGVFQAAPDSPVSKFQLISLFEKYFPAGRSIVPVNNKRVDKSLVPFWGNYHIKIKDYEPQIIEMKEWIESHPDLYPAYYYSKNQ